MMIVVGAITMTVGTSLKSYARADTHSRAINAARFTVDSFKRTVYPKVVTTNEIEILLKKDLPATVASDDINYLFLNNDGAVAVRNKRGDTPLVGSELVQSLNFTVPVDIVTSGGKYQNSILGMTLTTKAVTESDKEADAVYTVSLDIPLYNKPERSGTQETSARAAIRRYTGDVLKFYASTEMIDYNVILDNVHIRDANDPNTDLDNRTNVVKGITLRVVYDIHPSVDPGYSVKDVSTYEWYISGATNAPLNIKTSQPEGTVRESGYWQLVNEDGTPLTTQNIPTSGNFYVKTANGTVQWWVAGVIRCKVYPALAKTDGSDKKDGESQWSPYVVLEKKSPYNNRFFFGMKEALSLFEKTGERSDNFPLNSGTARTVVDADGTSYVQIERKDGTYGSTVMGKISMEYLKEVIERSKEDGKSYSSPTNISIIVDTLVDTGSQGYGILINGAVEKIGSGRNIRYDDTGYILQYDKYVKNDTNGANGFPIRLFAQVHHSGNDGGSNNDPSYAPGAFGVGNIEAYKSANSSYGGIYYEPSDMKTKKFIFNSTGTGSNGNRWPWRVRRRFMVTVLEYYMTDGTRSGKDYPRYIIRAKFLDEMKDDDEKDPFGCGESYFFSNPIWYGNFEGTDVDKNKSATIYTYSSYNNDSWKNTGSDKDNLYITRSPKGIYFNTGEDDYYNGVFQAVDMNVRYDIGRISYINQPGQGTSVNKTTAAGLFQSPQRDRIIGFRALPGVNGKGAKVYDIVLAPGFTKKELQAIMPKGAKMYELSDILTTNKLKDIKDSPDDYGFTNSAEVSSSYNKILNGGSSDGICNGSGIDNGVNGIQYQLNKDGTSGTWYGFRPSNRYLTSCNPKLRKRGSDVVSDPSFRECEIKPWRVHLLSRFSFIIFSTYARCIQRYYRRRCRCKRRRRGMSRRYSISGRDTWRL